jgi:hypothetical protein
MSGRRMRRSETASGRLGGPRWRAREAPLPADVDQEQEVRAKLYAKRPATERTVEVLGTEIRAKLYAKPPATQRTVEVLGTLARIAHRPAA